MAGPPSGRFLVKHATATVEAGAISREIVLVALEPDGQLGPELRLTALDEPTYRYFATRLGEEVSMGVVRRRRR